MTAQYFARTLAGGTRLVGECVPGRQSVSLGVWFDLGSRDEEPRHEGMAHFIEHLVFKGTRQRDALEIAASLERVGGSLDAFTMKDATCFHARVLEEHLPLAMEVLGDLVSNPRFAGDDVERERQVVLEELRAAEDTPDEFVGDLAFADLWPDDILGASILGTPGSLARLDARRVDAFHRREYCASRAVVAAAGAVDPALLSELVERHMPLPAETPESRRALPSAAAGSLTVHPLELGQIHLNLMSPAPGDRTDEKLAVQLLAELFGGGMSSRLFQRIREEEGLAYSVYAYSEHFEDTGMFGIGLAVQPDRVLDALESTREEIRTLLRDGLRPGELDAAKAQMRGSIVMGQESLTNRMTHVARDALRERDHESIERWIERYRAITGEEVLAAAADMLDPDKLNLTVLGPASVGDFPRGAFRSVREVPVA